MRAGAPVGARRQHVLHVGDRPHYREHAARHHLADAEEGHREHDELDAVEQPGAGRSRSARCRSAGRCRWCPCSRPATPAARPLTTPRADRGERGEAEQHQREVLRRAEGERGPRERRREQREAERAERAGDERADRGDAERGAGAALQRHLVAVDAGHHRARFAGHADQHRGQRAAVLRAVVDAGEQDDRRGRVGAEGERQQQRDRRRRADARQHADHLPHQHAEEAHRRGA